MKNLYYKRIYVDMNDGNDSILNWTPKLIYSPEIPEDQTEEIPDKISLVAKITNGRINGCIKRGIFDNKIKKIHIENMRYYTGEDYKLEKICFPVSREIRYHPVDWSISFDELSKQLSAEDFVCWMKDNGMNACPIMK